MCFASIFFPVFVSCFRSLFFPVWFVRSLYAVGWQEALSAIFINFLVKNERRLEAFGDRLEAVANYLMGPYITTGGVSLPLTIIGLLDKRVELHSDTIENFPSLLASSRPNADVCVMASRIVYESEEVIRDIVERVWNTRMLEDGQPIQIPPAPDQAKFQFLKKFSREGTVAILFRRGNALVLAFRGTRPFVAADWATDFYFPCYDFPGLGRVHTGFLRALGLGHNDDAIFCQRMSNPESTAWTPTTFSGFLSKGKEDRKDQEKKLKDTVRYFLAAATEDTELRSGASETENKLPGSLYTDIRDFLDEFFSPTNQKAMLFITGHSLGGALAALFTALLTLEGERYLRRVAGLYTFGQPRVGDWTFVWRLNNRLNLPELRYVRMMYCSDLVTHVPFDFEPFEFKHLGPFHLSNANYYIKIGTYEDQPRLTFPDIRPHLSAAYELFYNTVWNRSANLFLRVKPYRRPNENPLQVLVRVFALITPRLAAHNPVNYVNAVRHGMPRGSPGPQVDNFGLAY